MKTADKFKALRGQMRMSQVELAKFLDMSPGSVYKYEKGQHVPRVDILEKMEAFVNQTTEIKSKGELRMNNSKFIISTENNKKQENHIDANYVVGLQKNEIERLNSEVEELNNTVEQYNRYNKQSYDEITDYDSETKTQMIFSLSGVSRTMLSMSNLDLFAKNLGYKLDELSCYLLLGEEFKMNEHPIEKLLHKNSIKLIDSLLKSLPKAFNILKGMVGCHYIPINLSYIHKKGHLVHTMNYCSANWSTKVVSTKTKFLN